MPNGLNDDPYSAVNLSERENIDSFMRINSFLNNSLDLRSLASNPTQQPSIDTMLNGLMVGCENVEQKSVLPKKQSTGSVGSGDSGGNMALSRLLAHTYSYSSDTSSPNTPLTPHTNTTQMYGGRNSVFSYLDDSSPQSCSSGSSKHSINYRNSPATNHVKSPLSEPGSPTMEDAILMGCRDSSNCNNEKLTDVTIANLISSLSLGNTTPNSNTSPSVFSSPLNSFTRSNNLERERLQPQLPNAASLGLNYQQSQMSQNLSNPSNIQDLSCLSPFQNAWLTSQLLSGLDSSLLPDGKLSNAISSISSPTDPYAIEKAAKLHRNAAAICDAQCTWSGQLPARMPKNPVYSCKVFLGGVPWDVTETTLKQTFLNYGNIQVEWPGKESSANPPRGYVYILFEHEKQVKSLLCACNQDFSNGGNYYYKISSRRIRQKEVQIIPWVIGDSNYVRCPSYQLDPAKTVFVGALHGMLSAEGLAIIMNDLFGGVVYSGIDTDKHKYPIGSGRVTFNNIQSYKKAVRAAFIEIKTTKFTKKVQVDPYLADSLCQLCGMQQGPYFCRDELCFKYLCRSCWQLTHPPETHSSHKPIMRNSKLRGQTTLARMM